MTTELGEAFARALGGKDAAALRGLLRPDLDFRGLTPGDFWQADNAAAVIDDILLGKWFESSDEIREVVSVETATVGSRGRVGYRFRVANGSSEYLVDQQAYYEPDGNQIGWLRIICSGFNPIVPTSAQSA